MAVKFGRFWELGFKRTCLCYTKKLYLVLLRYWFGFDKWHASTPFECRPYKQEAVTVINELEPNVVVEIGCGLGEIISRVECERRIGIDRSGRVIRAARFLYGSSCVFMEGSIADHDSLVEAVGGHADVLVAINWPHSLPWSELYLSVRVIAGRLAARYLLIDGINPGVPGYAFHHGLGEFRELGEVRETVRSSDGIRTLYLIAIER
ncbi:MAG: hypothetical protein ACRD22_15650 [Terriglobia bacterium]